MNELDSVANTVIERYLRPYQLEYLRCNEKKVVGLKARRIGFTHVALLRVLLKCLRWRRHSYTIITTTADLSQEHLDEIRTFWIPLLRACGVQIPVSSDTQRQIRLANGSTIRARACDSDNLRGYGGSFLVDEMAYLPDRHARKLFDAVIPITEDGQHPENEFRGISTPGPEDGLYWELCTDYRGLYSDWVTLKVDIQRAVEGGYPFNFETFERMPQARIDREYRCKFAPFGSHFFSRRDFDPLLFAGELSFARSLSIDLGSRNDSSAVVLRDGEFRFGPTYMMAGMTYMQHLEPIASLVEEHDPEEILVDATRNETFAELLEDAYGDRVVRVDWKHGPKKAAVEEIEQLVGGLQLALRNTTFEWTEDGRWKRVGVNQLMDDLCSIEQKRTPSGLLTYQFPRDAGGHGDAGSALLQYFMTGERYIPISEDVMTPTEHTNTGIGF